MHPPKLKYTTRLEAAQMKFLRHLLGITKLDKEKNQCIREKTGAQNIVKEIKQYQKKWLQHVQRMDTNRIPKQSLQYQPKGRRNIGVRGRDGGTNFILRIQEEETRLTLHEHDDDDDDEKYKIIEIRNLCVCFKECVSLERLKTGYESDDSDKLRGKLSLCLLRKHVGKKRCAPFILSRGVWMWGGC